MPECSVCGKALPPPRSTGRPQRYCSQACRQRRYAHSRRKHRDVHVLCGDCRIVLAGLADQSVQMCLTSPPYWRLRDNGAAGQIGLEATLDAYVHELVGVFREVRRVLRNNGTLWLNLGDAYSADGRGFRSDLPPKNLLGMPWRVALALQADGWILRSAIIWHKLAVMPESVRDRPTSAYELLFLFSKSGRAFYDADAIAEDAKPESAKRYRYAFPGNPDGINRTSTLRNPQGRLEFNGKRNCRNVWQINPQPFKGAHFSVMPVELAERCILAGSRVGDTVMDLFGGTGTTGCAALKHGRDAVLIELNPRYVHLAEQRLAEQRRLTSINRSS
jgi:DNA modification methylase